MINNNIEVDFEQKLTIVEEPLDVKTALSQKNLHFVQEMEIWRLAKNTIFKRHERANLGRTRTRSPDLKLSAEQDRFLKKTRTVGFTVSSEDEEPKMTAREREMLILLIGTSRLNKEENFGIPKNAKSVSFVHEGFEFGETKRHCMDFKPRFQFKDGEYMEYFFKSSRVQVATWCGLKSMRRSAGVCWWFGDDSDASFNLHLMFEIQRDQLLENIQEIRRDIFRNPSVRSRSGHDSKQLLKADLLRMYTGKNGESVVMLNYELGRAKEEAFEKVRGNRT